MMERILLGVLCLSGWLILGTCLVRQYHFVNESLNWYDALYYCRNTYKDLASIENSTEMNQLIQTVSSAGHNSEVWIGAQFYLSGHYTNNIGDDFWSWENQTQDEPFSVYYLCFSLTNSGYGQYDNCSVERPFICSNGSSQNYVYVNESMDWFRALRYCRENFTDLVYSWSYPWYYSWYYSWYYQNSFYQLIPVGSRAWIGLLQRPRISWADGSGSSFKYWDDVPKIFGSSGGLYGAADLQRSGKWRLLSYDTRLPFVCYGPQKNPVKQNNPVKDTTHKKVFKLRMKVEDPSVNLNDPAVKAELLKKFHEKLNVTGVTLKWREQPDGEVFQKEREKKKKSEL